MKNRTIRPETSTNPTFCSGPLSGNCKKLSIASAVALHPPAVGLSWTSSLCGSRFSVTTPQPFDAMISKMAYWLHAKPTVGRECARRFRAGVQTLPQFSKLCCIVSNQNLSVRTVPTETLLIGNRHRKRRKRFFLTARHFDNNDYGIPPGCFFFFFCFFFTRRAWAITFNNRIKLKKTILYQLTDGSMAFDNRLSNCNLTNLPHSVHGNFSFFF